MSNKPNDNDDWKDEWREHYDNVTVRFANDMGQNTFDATVYYKVKNDKTMHKAGIYLEGPGSISVTLNYIDRIEMGDKTAIINISSRAFDGQLPTAYFDTKAISHPGGSTGTIYKVLWRSGGSFRQEWYYSPTKYMDDDDSGRYNARNVYVYFRNKLGSGTTMKATIHFKMQYDDRDHTWHVNYGNGESGYINLNYIDRIVMDDSGNGDLNGKIALIEASSRDFDGQSKVVYYDTKKLSDHATRAGPIYVAQWESGGVIRGQSVYN